MQNFKYKIVALGMARENSWVIAAKLVARLVDLKADRYSLKVAMESFASIIAPELEALIDQIETNPAYKLEVED